MSVQKFSAPNLIIAGGGTGGHIMAGVAIAQEWQKQFPQATICFVGAEGGLEEKLVPRAGFRLELLRTGSLKGVGIKKKLQTLLKIPGAIVKSIKILKKERPSAIVGVGGYASGPLILSAWLVRAVSGFVGPQPVLGVLEQNAVPGLTNRILSKICDLVFTSFEDRKGVFHKQKTYWTGNPVREEFFEISPNSVRKGKFKIFIFGGSQGAMGINTLVIEALPELMAHAKASGVQLEILHQTGERDYERVKQAHEKHQTGARVEKFVYDMKDQMESSTLIICRSGASTLAELAAAGRASILIPFPQASDNHQEINARYFLDAGAACLKLQSEGSKYGNSISELILSLLKDPQKLEEMAKNAKQLSAKDSAQKIVKALT